MNVQDCSNNTNKLSPQEQNERLDRKRGVQLIQINLVLKNRKQFDADEIGFK